MACPVRFVWLCVATGFVLWSCFVLTASAQPEKVPYRLYTTTDGLPDEEVGALAQTPDGLLWIGTRTGLAVFDGRRFHTVVFPDSLGLVSIVDIVPRPDGSVWVASTNGAMQVRHGRLIRAELAGEAVSRILAHGDTLHFVTRRTLWTLSPGAPGLHALPFDYPIAGTPALLSTSSGGTGAIDADLDPAGSIWVLDGGFGPGRVQPDGSVDFVKGPQGRQGHLWSSLRFMQNGQALATQENRAVYHFDPASQALTLLLRNDTVSQVYGERGIGYVTSNEGVLRWDVQAQRWLTPLGTALGLPTNFMRSILRDRERSLWIGTSSGLLHLFAPDVRHLQALGGSALYYLGNFSHGPDSTLWVSSYGGGLVQLYPQRARFMPDDERAWGQMSEGLDGHLHALGASGWYRYQPQDGWHRVEPHAGAVSGFVGADGHGYFWHDDGFFRHDPARPAHPVPLVRWPAPLRNQYHVTPLPGGDFVLRSQDFLLRGRLGPDPETPPTFDTLAALPGYGQERGRYMAFDTWGRAWMPFRSRGLLLVETEGERPQQRLLLPGRPVRRIALSGDSLVFVGSFDGLYLLDATDGALRHHLTKAQGLVSNRVNGATLFGEVLYVSHEDGVSMIPLRSLYDRQPTPTMLITGVAHRDEPVDLNKPPVLGASDREVRFTFAAPLMRQPDQVRYEYRLVPYEEAWRMSSQGIERYVNLKPASYRFEVRARMGEGAPGDVAVYAFEIPPFFYETWWFLLFVGVSVLGLGIAGYRLRVASLTRRQEHLETLVAERTERLRQEKRKTEDQARRLEELDQAKNRFFANVSHEFRTPLQLITGPLEQELAQTDDPRLQRQLATAHRNANRLLHLVNQLLDLARLESGEMTLHPEPGDLADFLQTLGRSFMPLAERKQITLHTRVAAPSPFYFFDPDKLEKIVGNLLANALKFTPQGGRVWVTLHAPSDATPVEITVKDTGPGIPAAVLPHIFERFRQADDSTTRIHEGTGIGLALARELVDMHGGDIFAESEPGFGALFTVRLPLRAYAGEAPPPLPDQDTTAMLDGAVGSPGELKRQGDASHSTAVSADAPTVLLVEDNAEVRGLVRSYLEPDYQVLEAAQGQAGLETARATLPDLILSDVMMPVMDGLTLVQAVKADDQLRSIPVILLTARAAVQDTVEGLEAGADDYLPKPFTAAELRARVARHIAAWQQLRTQFSREIRVEPSGIRVSSEEELFLQQILETIEAQMGDALFGAAALAEAVGLSPRQLRRRLRATMGESPAALIRRLRLERAAQLVEGRAGTIAEIAYRVGFNDPDYFSTAYRKHFGHPPTNTPTA